MSVDQPEPNKSKEGENTKVSSSAERLTPTSRIYLDIPHHSQLDIVEHNINPTEARSVCAIMCIKSIVEYELGASTSATSYNTLKSEVETYGGKHPNGGWTHFAMVDAIKSHGLIAWRRNWRAPNQDTTFFAEHEGYDRAQMAAVEGQIRVESLLSEEVRTKAQTSIVDSLQAGHPVIVSVGPGFSENADNHLVVIHGFERKDGAEMFYITDPVKRDPEHQTQAVPVDFFFSKFNERAIFVAGKQNAVA